MLRQDYSVWHCGQHDISLSRPRIMGVLNVTPDSFSDGGENLDATKAITHALRMLDEGADIIDVGGESTRPGHTPVSAEEEAQRVVPVIRGILERAPQTVISIDTRHASVAKMCVRLGASIINDVTGFSDPEMIKVAAQTDCGCIIMHWEKFSNQPMRKSVQLDSARPVRERIVPQSSRRFTLPDEGPIMRSIMGFLGDQARLLMRAGVNHSRICIDPGPGFDKDANENVVIQRAMHKLVSMGYPVLTAVSRKRFVGAVSSVAVANRRDSATMGICIAAIAAGSRIVRVHNVKMAAEVINGYWSCAQADARQAFIALGSNTGDYMANLALAVKRINEIPLTGVVQVSHVYETEPAYGIATKVANAVVEARTELAPLCLLDELMAIEKELKRTRSLKSRTPQPRTIDCDLCYVEGETHAGQKLTLPHPRLAERDFVLVPMEDLMHDPARFLSHAGIEVLPPEQRVGHVIADLGTVDWE